MNIDLREKEPNELEGADIPSPEIQSQTPFPSNHFPVGQRKDAISDTDKVHYQHEMPVKTSFFLFKWQKRIGSVNLTN